MQAPAGMDISRFNQTFQTLTALFQGPIRDALRGTYLGVFLVLVMCTAMGLFAWRLIKAAFSS